MTARTWAPRGAALGDRLAFHSERVASGCLEWTAGRDKDGYGYLQVAGRKVRAHRVAYELARGPLAPGALVRHACDNPPCIEPGHLLAGDHDLNAQDRVQRGRFNPESARYNRVRLSIEKARVIRERAAYGVPHRVLAAEFGVGRDQISRVVNHINWKEAS